MRFAILLATILTMSASAMADAVCITSPNHPQTFTYGAMIWHELYLQCTARELAARCGLAVSASTIGRWLAGDALKPWQHRSWISVRDPQFAARAAPVLDLYAGIWEGRPLGPDDYVICADEKTSIQARCRCHPTLPPGKARAMRVEHDYDRGGALAYLAAWDVRRGQITGRCEDTTGIAPFARLVAQVMAAEPYASANRVFWITDNGSSHRGAASIQRMAQAWPNAQLIHLQIGRASCRERV